MDSQEIERFRAKLEAFLVDLVSKMGRKERAHWANVYVRGLLLNGERKSIEPMASRLPDGDVQALQQFVNQSPWPSLSFHPTILLASRMPDASISTISDPPGPTDLCSK